MLTQQRAEQLWDYIPETGVFLSKRYKARQVGTLTKAGYRVIEADGKQYLAHRLAWLYTYGEFPVSSIDHLDTNKDNNSISNLRLAKVP